MLKTKSTLAASSKSAGASAKRPGYFRTLGQDAPAVLVVFLVALPLCLGISLASGAPLLAGVITGIVGGLPLTAVIVRSSANISAGGQSKMALFIHGLLLPTSLLLLSPFLNWISLSALAAVLLAVGFRLTKPALYLHEEMPHADEVVQLKLAGQVSFLNKASITKVLHAFPAGSRVVRDGTGSSSINYDVLEAIESFRLSARERGINLGLRNIPQVHVLGH